MCQGEPGSAHADPDRRELHGAGTDGAGAHRRRVRLRHARCAAHRRRDRLDARRRARAGGRRRDVESSVPGSQLPSPRRDDDLPLARIRRLGRCGARGARRAQGRPCRHACRTGHRHSVEREGDRALQAVTFTRHFDHWPPGQPRTLELPPSTVYDNLADSAARYPDRAAIDYYGSRISYAELKRQVDALAGHLRARCGIARGERVILYAQNSPQYVIAYYAIIRAGAVVVPVNPMNRTEELRHYVEDSDARLAIAGIDVLREIQPLGIELLPI